jgi:hypothetical protein
MAMRFMNIAPRMAAVAQPAKRMNSSAVAKSGLKGVSQCPHTGLKPPKRP